MWEAVDTHTGSRVAVKKMSVTADDYSSDGFPISALREVTYQVFRWKSSKGYVHEEPMRVAIGLVPFSFPHLTPFC